MRSRRSTTCSRRRSPDTPGARPWTAGRRRQRARRRRRAGDGRGGLGDRAHRRQLARRLRRAAARRARPRAIGRRARAGRRVAAADESQRRRWISSPAMQPRSRPRAPDADALLSSPEGRRRRTEFSTVELRAHPGRAARPPDARADRLRAALSTDRARAARGFVAAQSIDCPVRIVWGTADRS